MANTRSNNTSQSVNVTTEDSEKAIIPKEIDQNQFVIVRNGFQGRLIYKSRTGEKFVWDEFGSEQEIELRELKNAKSSHKKMFENNWFMFDEPWVIDYLGVKQYYANALTIENFDDVFNKPPSELKKIISGMSDGLKKSIAYRARQLIIEGIIDSRKTISTLEEVLKVELVEK